MDTIEVLIVERERAVAQAVARRLDGEPDFVVVASAHTAMGAITAADRVCPDVIVFDEGVVDGDLVEILHRLLGHRSGTGARRLVVISEHEDPARAYESIRAGASAFVSKAAGADEMIETIRGVAAGETRISPSILSAVLDEFRSREQGRDQSPGPLPELTAREREVLECLIGGLDRVRISERLGVSVHTVRTHAQSIFAKLDVHSSVEAVSVATRAGILGSAVRS